MNKAELKTILEYLGEEYIDEDTSIRHLSPGLF